MRGLGLGLVLWALGATVASAAVLRVDVTGTPVLAQITGAREVTGNSSSLPDPGPLQFGGNPFTSGDLTATNTFAGVGEFLRATSGHLEIELEEFGPRVASCSGLLLMFCVRSFGFDNSDRLAVDFVRGTLQITSSTFIGGHRLDNTGYNALFEVCFCIFESDERTFIGALAGLELEATFSSARLSVLDQPTPVPLPASAPLALAGLGALALLRRQGQRGRGGAGTI